LVLIAALAFSQTALRLCADAKELLAIGTYVHEPTKRRFREEVGEVRRAKVLQYDQAGRDISVGDNLEKPGRLIAATMYVYPLRSEGFAAELREVEHAHANFQLAFERDVVLKRGTRSHGCRMAGMSYEERFAGKYGLVASYLLICDAPVWRVKWRFTHLPSGDNGLPEVMKELAATLTVRE
jgi:hypothetical protein